MGVGVDAPLTAEFGEEHTALTPRRSAGFTCLVWILFGDDP